MPESEDFDAVSVVNDAEVEMVTNPFQVYAPHCEVLLDRPTDELWPLFEANQELSELLIYRIGRLVSAGSPPVSGFGELASCGSRELDNGDGSHLAPEFPQKLTRVYQLPTQGSRLSSADEL